MTWLRLLVLAFVVLLLALAAAIVTGLVLGQRRAARHITLDVPPIAIRDDTAAIARGSYLYASRGCVDCHGPQAQGATIAEDGQGTLLAGPNLTIGNPTMARYTPADWVRSVRHGVGADGRPLRLMPSEDYARFTDVDLAAIVAFVRQLPPRHGREHGVIELPLPARVLYGFGAIPEAVTKIDHSLPPSTPVPEVVSLSHGAYVAQVCAGCHGPQFLGGKIDGAPPDWPPAARLAPGPGSAMVRYPTAAAFIAMMRSGQRPDGSRIAVMPFGSLGAMNDVDLGALHLYLTRLP